MQDQTPRRTTNKNMHTPDNTSSDLLRCAATKSLLLYRKQTFQIIPKKCHLVRLKITKISRKHQRTRKSYMETPGKITIEQKSKEHHPKNQTKVTLSNNNPLKNPTIPPENQNKNQTMLNSETDSDAGW